MLRSDAGREGGREGGEGGGGLRMRLRPKLVG